MSFARMDETLDRHGIGGNRPPIVDQISADTREMLDGFKPDRERYLAALKAQVVRSRATAGDATDVVGYSRDVRKLIEEERLKLTRPLDTARDGAIAQVHAFWEEVEAAADALEHQVVEFDRTRQALMRAQQQQQQAEEKRRRDAAHAAETPSPPVAAPTAAPLRPIKGDLGKRLVSRARKVAVLVDITKVPPFVFNAKRVRDALEAVATDFAKNMDAIDGFDIKDQERTGVQ